MPLYPFTERMLCRNGPVDSLVRVDRGHQQGPLQQNSVTGYRASSVNHQQIWGKTFEQRPEYADTSDHDPHHLVFRGNTGNL